MPIRKSKKSDRYDTSQLVEAQFEPGSRGRVLKNLLGITTKKKMDVAEQQEQFRVLEELLGIYGRDHRFTAQDACRIHRQWLGPIYAWAGQYRQVNVIKGNFPFAAARQIPLLMAEFETGPLFRYTPCSFDSVEEVSKALAIVHAELVLIHPFREGNGRAARLLADLMAAQAGLPVLNFDNLLGKKRIDYFNAVKSALDRDYEPMVKIFMGVIDKTLWLQKR